MNSKLPLLLPCRVRRFLLGGFLATSTVLIASSSSAQGEYPSGGFDFGNLYRPEIYRFDRRDRETGFRLGRARLHALLGVLGTYDTNALYADRGTSSDFVYQLIPGVDFQWGGSRLDLNLGYRFTFRKNVENGVQDSNSHHVNLDTRYRITRTLQFVAGDQFEDSSDPADVELLQRVGRITNEARGGLKYVTPGEDLDVSAVYTNLYQKYDTTLAGLTFYNNKVSLTSRFNISSQFRFLPKSVASIGAEYGQTSFDNDPAATVSNSNSKGINFTAGLSSQFSRKFSASAKAGASFLFFNTGPDSKIVSGGLDLQYSPRPGLNFQAGYERIAQISTFTNFHEDHRFHLGGLWRFARRFEMADEIRLFLIHYSGPNVTLNNVFRDDNVIQNIYRISCAIVEWAKVRAEYQFDRRSSNALDPVLGTPSADFMKHQVSLGVDFYY